MTKPTPVEPLSAAAPRRLAQLGSCVVVVAAAAAVGFLARRSSSAPPPSAARTARAMGAAHPLAHVRGYGRGEHGGDERERVDPVEYAAQWARHDPVAALAWCRQLGDAALRLRALAAIGSELAHRDPLAAAEFALAQPEDADRTCLFNAIALEEGGAGVEASREIAMQWAGMSPIAAGTWVRALPAGPNREAAFSAYIEVLCLEGPAVAAGWLAHLPKDELPPALIEKVADEWFRLNPTAAKRWRERLIASVPLE